MNSNAALRRSLFAVIAAAALIVTAGCSDNESVRAADSQPLAGTLDPTAKPVPAEKLEQIRKAQGDRITPADESKLAPQVRREAAIAAAQSEFQLGSRQNLAPPSPEATLAMLTITNKGKNLETDNSKPDRIEPDVKDRLAWIVLLHNVEIPILGTPGDGQGIQTQMGDFAVYVDAKTGKVLRGLTI